MSIFRGFKNRHLIHELKQELNTDIILFGVDGLSYFGHLQEINRDELAIMTAAVTSSSGFVEILTPSEIVEEPNYVMVDLSLIVGKGTAISADPFIIDPPAVMEEGEDTDLQQRDRKEGHRSELPDFSGRGEKHSLTGILQKNIGAQVSIGTVGGFLFQGILVGVSEDLATLSETEILAPGMDSSIENVGSALVNLLSLSSVSA